jgi:hypothetical protein
VRLADDPQLLEIFEEAHRVSMAEFRGRLRRAGRIEGGARMLEAEMQEKHPEEVRIA